MLTIKSCLTAIFLCSLLSQINAQLNAEIGVIGGMIRPSLHNFEGSAIAPYDPMQPAPMGGLGFSFRLFKPLYFRTEFIYEERRWEPANVTVVFPEDGTLGLASISRRYPFLTMPFLLELRYGKRVQLFGNTGVNPAYRLPGVITSNPEGGVPAGWLDFDDPQSKFDLSWVFGGGFNVGLFRQIKIGAQFRYFRSWTTTGVNGPTGYFLKYKGWIFSTGCYYNLGQVR